MKQTKPAQAMELRSLSPVFGGLDSEHENEHVTGILSRRPSFQSMALRSVVVCILGGAIVGSFSYVMLTAIWTRSVYGLPWLLWLPFHALLITVPLGTVFGLAGALTAWLVRRGRWAPTHRPYWTLLSGCVGAILAATTPALLALVNLGPRELEMRYLWTAIGSTTGAVCGATVGWQTWPSSMNSGAAEQGDEADER